MAITIGVKWINLSGAHNVYVGRGSPLGNPEPMKDKSDTERNRVCDFYEEWLGEQLRDHSTPQYQALFQLYGLAKANQDINLQCYCGSHKRCHALTIKRRLEAALEKYK